MLAEGDYISVWQGRTIEDINTMYDKLSGIVSSLNNEALDAIANTTTKEVYEKVDCLACGNCCRTSVTDFSIQDINRASKYLGISKKRFIGKYLIEDLDGQYITISSPCPFLNLEDNKCQIYEARPFVCDSYPHTDRANFVNRSKAHKSNIDMCPITYTVINKIWEHFEEKNSRPTH